MACPPNTFARLLSILFTTTTIAEAQLFVTDINRLFGSAIPLDVRTNGPVGQSFTAVTNSIGWVKLMVERRNPFIDAPASVHVNLRNYVEVPKPASNAGAVSGTVVASSYPVILTNGFAPQFLSDATRFIFPTNVPVVATQKYWWEFVWDSGDDVIVRYYHFLHEGDVIAGGTNFGRSDSLWDIPFDAGTIQKYPEIKQLQLMQSPFLFRFQMDGFTGQQCLVEISTNSVNWTAYRTNVFDGFSRTIDFPDIESSEAPSRLFFRLRYVEPR